jgi:hypothetical protein
VLNINNITAIGAGVQHTCAAGAQLYCWGRNAVGQHRILRGQHQQCVLSR